MLLQGVQKVCCCVVKLISFERYEQNTAKKATIEDYLVNFVNTINTLRHSSQAAKKFVIVNITRLVLNNRNQICPKKPLFKKLLQILRIWSSICFAIKTACCAIKTACCGKISTPCQILTPLFCSLEKKASELTSELTFELTQSFELMINKFHGVIAALWWLSVSL